jgi:DNA-binding NtrC family response regulator
MDRALGESYECEFASSIEEARDRLGNGTFHLVICNLDSADTSGLDRRSPRPSSRRAYSATSSNRFGPASC